MLKKSSKFIIDKRRNFMLIISFCEKKVNERNNFMPYGEEKIEKLN